MFDISLGYNFLLCFDDGNQSKRWVRRFKFIYLWALLLLPLAHWLAVDYLCQMLRFLTIFGAFIIICHIPYDKISKFKKVCPVCLYCGLGYQIVTLLGHQMISLLS